MSSNWTDGWLLLCQRGVFTHKTRNTECLASSVRVQQKWLSPFEFSIGFFFLRLFSLHCFAKSKDIAIENKATAYVPISDTMKKYVICWILINEKFVFVGFSTILVLVSILYNNNQFDCRNTDSPGSCVWFLLFCFSSTDYNWNCNDDNYCKTTELLSYLFQSMWTHFLMFFSLSLINRKLSMKMIVIIENCQMKIALERKDLFQ